MNMLRLCFLVVLLVIADASSRKFLSVHDDDGDIENADGKVSDASIEDTGVAAEDEASDADNLDDEDQSADIEEEGHDVGAAHVADDDTSDAQAQEQEAAGDDDEAATAEDAAEGNLVVAVQTKDGQVSGKDLISSMVQDVASHLKASDFKNGEVAVHVEILEPKDMSEKSPLPKEMEGSVVLPTFAKLPSTGLLQSVGTNGRRTKDDNDEVQLDREESTEDAELQGEDAEDEEGIAASGDTQNNDSEEESEEVASADAQGEETEDDGNEANEGSEDVASDEAQDEGIEQIDANGEEAESGEVLDDASDETHEDEMQEDGE